MKKWKFGERWRWRTRNQWSSSELKAHIDFNIDTECQVNVSSFDQFTEISEDEGGKLNVKQTNIILESFGGYNVDHFGVFQWIIGSQVAYDLSKFHRFLVQSLIYKLRRKSII